MPRGVRTRGQMRTALSMGQSPSRADHGNERRLKLTEPTTRIQSQALAKPFRERPDPGSAIPEAEPNLHQVSHVTGYR
jgi:hypothetical protein